MSSSADRASDEPPDMNPPDMDPPKRRDTGKHDRPPRFFADAMLGSLARWLRAAGLDVLYEADIDDAELVGRAVADLRTILTRDRRLVERRLARDHLLIASDELDEQLLQVIATLDLDRLALRPFGRCLDCNTELSVMAYAEARPRVPAYVARTRSRFRYCSECDRVFWRATHVVGMEAKLAALGLRWPDEAAPSGPNDGVD